MMEIKVGKYYRCIKTVHMEDDPNDIRYIEGKIYKSELQGCITDETGEKRHLWAGIDLADKIFSRVFNKRKRREDSRVK